MESILPVDGDSYTWTFHRPPPLTPPKLSGAPAVHTAKHCAGIGKKRPLLRPFLRSRTQIKHRFVSRTALKPEIYMVVLRAVALWLLKNYSRAEIATEIHS